MIIFYSENAGPSSLTLTAEDSLHCAKVLRHKTGDSICVIDGRGTMYECRITDANPKSVVAAVEKANPGWNAHPYKLTMAVCPTKNNDRYEWFIEKATEVGLDTIVPVIGEHSERKVYKTDRARKIAISASKQSLKSAVPCVDEPLSVKEFIMAPRQGLKFIAYCFEDPSVPRISLIEALTAVVRDGDAVCGAIGPLFGPANCAPLGTDAGGLSQQHVAGSVLQQHGADSLPQITILIGPEGDFSEAEAKLAVEHGYVPVHLGESRLRTETAAIVAATMVYTSFMK